MWRSNAAPVLVHLDLLPPYLQDENSIDVYIDAIFTCMHLHIEELIVPSKLVDTALCILCYLTRHYMYCTNFPLLIT